ncbi:hypothetical protein [Endozoicomonas sp. 2B-B]
MDRLSQQSFNPSTCGATADIKGAADHGKVSGRTFSSVSGEPFGVNRAVFIPDPATGQQDQKEIGISSRAVAVEVDTREATISKPKLDFTDVRVVKPEALSPRPLRKLKAIQSANAAIISDRQVGLIQGLIDGRSDRLTKDEFIDVADFLPYRPETYLPEDYFKSETLLEEIVRNRLWCAFSMTEGDKIRDVLLSTADRTKKIFLNDIRNLALTSHYKDFSEELKSDIDFLIEYSNVNGLPKGTPPKQAQLIYGYLDIAAKIRSLSVLPHSFKDDELYDELINSGRIELKDLPQHIINRKKDYCLLQLSKGRCQLSEVPDRFITKKSILDSLDGENLCDNFSEIFNGNHEYKVLINDDDFFEEVLFKTASAILGNRDFARSYTTPLPDIYHLCIERYKTDRDKLALLLNKLVIANPFIVVSIKNTDDRLLQGLIEKAKWSLLRILINRPEKSENFSLSLLDKFFEKINAGDDFKNQVMGAVCQYFPIKYFDSFSDELLTKQDDIVLNSEPFWSGATHIIKRGLRPDKGDLIVSYIELHLDFLHKFNDAGYLEQCCNDPALQQRLVHILAARILANKPLLLRFWKDRLPRKLLDDTLAYLNDPALFSRLDSSVALTEPVNPLKFQQPNTVAFKLLASLHAYSFEFANKDASCQLQSEFARAGETEFPSVYPGQHRLSLFEKEGTIVGGRTLAITNGEEVDYYKFQRVGESVTTLAQEGVMHQFIAKSDRFKSQKPRFGQYLTVLEKDLPESTRGFTDRLQVINVDGERAVRVYFFKATKHYGQYAHTPDITNASFAVAERGLLKGIHDIGVLNGNFGVMPTSTIPAFHDTGRRWVFLTPLLGSMLYALPLPGTFGGWIKAIERPDFGWDGLRDWGDVEFYGSMKSGLTARDSKTSGYTPEVMQRLSFANALCENLLAAVLLRSRLRRDSPDYHYQNQRAVEETENFIEQLLNEYLSGLLAKEKESPSKSRLQELMGLDEDTYRSWLNRTAREIIYWTARQPDEATFDRYVECFSKHIKETGNLDSTLYPEGLSIFDMQKKFPRDFHNVNDELNLGANNAVFPLVSLVKGLTLLVGNIFAFAHQVHG